MNKKTLAGGGALLVIGVVAGLGWAQAQQMGHGKGHGMHDGANHAMMHGMMNAEGEHDVRTHMYMLEGKDTTDAEVEELADMFTNHTDLTRSVELLPNGIKTSTETENEALRASLVSHVTGMIGRVDDKRDPEIFIQSPTLDILFERAEKIVTEITPTEKGVMVVQTSDDPEVVKALQVHSGEVSAMAERGMAPVHEAMMANPDAYK